MMVSSSTPLCRLPNWSVKAILKAGEENLPPVPGSELRQVPINGVTVTTVPTDEERLVASAEDIVTLKKAQMKSWCNSKKNKSVSNELIDDVSVGKEMWCRARYCKSKVWKTGTIIAVKHATVRN